MSSTRNHQNDVERGTEGDSGESSEIELPRRPAQPQHPEIGVDGNDPRRSEESHRDFDDSANDLWSLYGKKAKSHDQDRIRTLKEDMDGVLIYAGLLSAVLTAFVVPQLQNLKVNPANQSVYYQNQSNQLLDQISQQIASAGGQVPIPPLPKPLPYPSFYPLASDRRVNIFWIMSLICSLSAALLATLVQQWYRAYIRVSQQSRTPLETARTRLFLFEGIERLPMMAEAVPGLIHISLMLFFWGLSDNIWHIDTAVFIATVVPISLCASFYLYCVIESIRNPQSPYRTPFSGIIWYLIRKMHRFPYYNIFRGKMVKPASTGMELRQAQTAMKETKSRMERDVRAIQWLVDNINGNAEKEALALAIPGSFNQKWGRDAWKAVVKDAQSTVTVDPQSQQIQLHPSLPSPDSPREGVTVYDLCKCVRYCFETYSNEGDSVDTKERRRHMRGWVESAASFVCCVDVELGLFGEVGEVLSELGGKERTNDPLTIRSNPLFAVRWTCLSLVAIWKTVDSNMLQEPAKFALDGIAHFQTDYDGPDTVALAAAEKIDDYLKKAWASIVDLRLAFEPWSQNRTESEIRVILNSQEASILELERVANEAVGVEDVDWRISLLLDTIDGATNKLIRHLPGVCYSELKPVAPVTINKAFDFSRVETIPVPPQLIFPGQQIQSLCNLGQKLRGIIEGQNAERPEETLKSLESLREIPVSLRGHKYPMKRQIWRLLDLRDGGGLGFTIELFFLALRQLSSASLSDELKKEFYTGTFKAITSDWEKSKDSIGTQRILLDLLCDLVIRRRGVFSDFSYPPYIVDMLLNLVEKMVKGHRRLHSHINDVIQELENDDLRNRMDNNDLRGRALNAIYLSSENASS